VRHGAGIQPPFIMAALYLAVMNTSTLIRRRHFAVCAVGLAMLLPWGALHADDDHERARQALAEGLVLPLSTVLARLQEQGWPGQVLKVEFEHEQGQYIYEILLLQPDGRVAKLDVDAQNAQVLKVRQKGKH